MTILPIFNSIMNSITYILYSKDVDYCVLVDCGEWETLEPVLKKINNTVRTVLLTHGHFDHIYGLNKLLSHYPNIFVGTNNEGHSEIQDSRKNLSIYHNYPFIVKDYRPLILEDRQVLHFEGFTDITVIATPGHDSSCLTYKIGKDLFTGDAYIPGVKTFTQFPQGNKELAQKSLALISKMKDGGCNIHCGHHSIVNNNDFKYE